MTSPSRPEQDEAVRHALKRSYQPNNGSQWRSGYLYAESVVHATLAATPPPVEQDEAVRVAVEHMEQVLWGYDWLGTGTSDRLANEERREAWNKWAVIRHALGMGDPEDRP